MESEFTLPMIPTQLPSSAPTGGSLDSMLAQNEDLSSRLRLSIRRLSILENDLKEKKAELELAKSAASMASDQLFILKEKDRSHKESALKFQEQIGTLSERVNYIEPELLRLRKYREKIQTQVKPYIQEIRKQLVQTQENSAQQTHIQLEKELQIKELKNQILELSKNSKEQIRILEQRTLSTVELYEKSLQSFIQKENEYLQALAQLQDQASLLRMTRIKCDELENENIALKRSKEDAIASMLKEFDRLTNQHKENSEELVTLRLQSKEYESKISEDQTYIQKVDKRRLDLESQLDSLRFMWNAKNEENEKLKVSLSALERLNLELSQKLNHLRPKAD